MTTVMSWTTSSGEEGRCDAKCHHATRPECACICGGANHGVGTVQAIQNTREMAETMIENYAREHDMTVEDVDAHVNELAVYQMTLPILEQVEEILNPPPDPKNKTKDRVQAEKQKPVFDQIAMW